VDGGLRQARCEADGSGLRGSETYDFGKCAEFFRCQTDCLEDVNPPDFTPARQSLQPRVQRFSFRRDEADRQASNHDHQPQRVGVSEDIFRLNDERVDLGVRLFNTRRR
jgi:hypothetical protein